MFLIVVSYLTIYNDKWEISVILLLREWSLKGGDRMRLRLIADVVVYRDRLGEFKYTLAGFNCRFKDLSDDGSEYNLEIEFDGDLDVGSMVMDLIEKRPHQYILACTKDGIKTVPLMEKFLTTS